MVFIINQKDMTGDKFDVVICTCFSMKV